MDYLELVDATARIIRADKRGHLDNSLPPILQRLNLKTDDWLQRTLGFAKQYPLLFSKRRLQKAA